MGYCKNCGHLISDHVYFVNAETHEAIGMVCCGIDSKNEGRHTMEGTPDKGTLVLKPTCQCREIPKVQ